MGMVKKNRGRYGNIQGTGGNNNEGITSIKMRNENKLKFQKQQPQGGNGNPGMSSSAIVQTI